MKEAVRGARSCAHKIDAARNSLDFSRDGAAYAVN